MTHLPIRFNDFKERLKEQKIIAVSGEQIHLNPNIGKCGNQLAFKLHLYF